jgi:hypothetical protein
MGPGLGWFLRMVRWARNPRSEAKVRLVVGIVAICLVLAGIEYFGFWPDWARTSGVVGP